VDFSKARDLFGIIFKFRVPNCKIRDCGLILEKLRGQSAKCHKLEFPGIVFLKENPRPLPRSGAHRSTASGHSSARELRPRGGGEEGRAGELNDGVAAAREAVEGHLTGGGASARKGDDEGTLRAKRSVGGVRVFTDSGATFYSVEARRGRPSAFSGWH
jgi:hypothetical protein